MMLLSRLLQERQELLKMGRVLFIALGLGGKQQIAERAG